MTTLPAAGGLHLSPWSHTSANVQYSDAPTSTPLASEPVAGLTDGDELDEWDPLLSLLSAGDRMATMSEVESSVRMPKVRERNKNGAMCLPLSQALSLVPAAIANPSRTQPLRRWSAADVQADMKETGGVTAAAAAVTVTSSVSTQEPLVLLGVVSTGACLATAESVAGTGYRHEQLFSLGGVDLRLYFELSIRSSFQQRGKPKAATASKGATNSNRLHIQEESDLLVQGAPGIAVTTVAPNASLTKKHYPYLRLAQRTDGPLLAQQACGSIGQFIVTHRLLWAPPGTDIATLRVEHPTPVCKHGRTDEHDDCRFLDAYTLREEIIVPDGRGGWAEMRRQQFNLCILGEKQTASNSSPSAAPCTSAKRKQATVNVVAVAATTTAQLETHDNTVKRTKVAEAFATPVTEQ